MRPLHTLAIALAFVLGSCAATDASSRAADGSSPAGAPSAKPGPRVLSAMLPAPKQGFTLHATAEKAPTLRDVVAEFERAAGVHFLVNDESRAQLGVAGSGLLRDLEVPPGEAWRVVEAMLVQNGFLIVPSVVADPITIELVTRMHGQGLLKAHAIEIDAAAVDECADHPAVIFSTVVEVESLDARQLSTSLRQLFPDQQTQSILPLTGSQLLLMGLGPDLAKAVQIVRTADAMRTREMERERKPDAVPSATADPR